MLKKLFLQIFLLGAMFFIALAPSPVHAADNAPAKVTGVKLDNSDYKKLTVSWKTVPGADGYQIRYSRKKNMKNSRTVSVNNGRKGTCTLSSLSRKKTYYVEVRAFYKENGEKVYGPYSSIKHKKVKGKLIVLDAGHQRKGNSSLEPIGPGSSTKKAKVSSGTVGVSTGTPEYSLNLKVAKKIKKELEKRGYDVKMIRTTNNVNISNSKRAKKANSWGADAVIHIHANGSSNSSEKGILMISPTSKNPYSVKKLYKKCYNLSKYIGKAVCKATGAKNNGIWQTDTMTGINWSSVPVTFLEMGYMSNPSEDRKLAKASYQKKIAKGVADGLDKYFGRK